MKKNIVLASLAVLVFAFAASAQKAADFSGTWMLDVSKSKLAGPPIESQTLTVTQTAAELKVETATKRPAPPADAPQGGGMGGGRMGGRGMMGGDGIQTYTLDGKGVPSTMSGPMGDMQMTTTAKLDGSAITITRTVTTPMGERTSTEKWSLGSDGLLTIESTRPNREGGTDVTKRVFSKKS